MSTTSEDETTPVYGADRVYFDSDSHIMETADWLASFATEAVKPLLRPLAPQGAGPVVQQALDSAAARRADSEQTRKLLEEPIISGPKGWFAYGASTSDERSKALDQLGFHRQLVFPTFCIGQFVPTRNPEKLYGGADAVNRGMAAFCADDPRMLAVGYLPLADPVRALKALELGLELGIDAFMTESRPPGEHSPAHVDLEPIWARLEEAGVPVTIHIGGNQRLDPAYHNNGRPRPKDFLGGGENMRAKDYPALHHSPENFLTALVLDGVFERHPGLRCGVIELGSTWVPGLLQLLDHAAWAFRKNEPILAELSLKPSEYIRRQVRFSLFPYEDIGWLIQQAGEELFMFASDYPHPEGGRDPIGKFEASMDAVEIGAPARDRFYRNNMAELMGID